MKPVSLVVGATLTVGVLAGLGTAPAAGGTAPGGALAIRSASLSQAGLDLRWSVTLGHSFSGAAFGRRRSLCLLIKRPASGSLASELCVAPARRRGGSLRLERRMVTRRGAGRPRVIAATISRSGSSELTVRFTPQSVGWGYRALRWQVRSIARGTACAAGPSDAARGARLCRRLFPARPRLTRLKRPLPIGCRASGRTLVFSGSSRRHEIALTFDDGPWDDPPTIDFVRLLARYHVPATFFEIGDQIGTYDRTGAIEREMLADGDMIGDHTWTHPDMVPLSPAEQTSQLERTAHAIRHATGFTPCLWRPPYGDVSNQLDSLARRLGFLTIYWDIDPRDWSLPGTASIEHTVITDARNGGIVEMHFGGGPRQETLAALPTIITTLRRRGYEFVNVAQLLGLRMIYR